ncbi:hypothetical protein ACP4OV_013418 [Aristida adscensionis]
MVGPICHLLLHPHPWAHLTHFPFSLSPRFSPPGRLLLHCSGRLRLLLPSLARAAEAAAGLPLYLRRGGGRGGRDGGRGRGGGRAPSLPPARRLARRERRRARPRRQPSSLPPVQRWTRRARPRRRPGSLPPSSAAVDTAGATMGAAEAAAELPPSLPPARRWTQRARPRRQPSSLRPSNAAADAGPREATAGAAFLPSSLRRGSARHRRGASSSPTCASSSSLPGGGQDRRRVPRARPDGAAHPTPPPAPPLPPSLPPPLCHVGLQRNSASLAGSSGEEELRDGGGTRSGTRCGGFLRSWFLAERVEEPSADSLSNVKYSRLLPAVGLREWIEKMPPFVLAAAAAAVLLGFLYTVKSRRSIAKKIPPSPPSLPLLGHLHLIGRLPHRSLHELHLRYGDHDGLLLLRLGRRRTLVASTAAAAAELFRSHDLAFASRPRNAAGEKQMYGGANISFSPYGDHWRRAKKIAVVHLLCARRVESSAPVRAAEAAALVARAARRAARGEAVELRDLLCGYTNAVFVRAAAGAGGATAERLKRLLGQSGTLVAGFQAEDVLPAAAARLLRRASGLERKLEDMLAEWDRFLSEIVAEHKEKKQRKEKEEEDDFLDVLLRLREQEDGGDGPELTDDSIKSIVKDMIVAATDTTAITLEWAMAELVGSPRVMAKLQDEVARVAGAAGEPAAVAESELERMGYLRAVVKEVLRLHPPAPLLLPHESTAAAAVRGYEIPAKTALFVNAWAIGRDPAVWDAPEEFRPERFVVASGGASPVDFRGSDYRLLPFGAGRRACPGVNFAMPVVELALASLVRHFEWSLPGGMRPAELDMREAPGLTTPRRIPLVLFPRCKTTIA